MDDFQIGNKVELIVSGETGVVIGKATYLEGGTQHQVHYKDANGCAKTEWFYSGQLRHAA